MFPLQQCRVHSLVGTPSDVRAYFSQMTQSNDMGETQSNDMSQSRSNSSPAQSNGVGAQSNGVSAAPGDLHLTIFYSPHPEPSSYGNHHQHRASAGEGGLTKTEPEPAVLCLGHAVVPLNQYVMKWLSEGTSLRSGWFIRYVQHALLWASQGLCYNHPLSHKILSHNPLLS